MNYLDFDLLFERSSDRYKAQVLNSPAGQAATEFSLPVSELDSFLSKMGRSRTAANLENLPEPEIVKIFGRKLFEAVFHDEVYTCFRRSLDSAKRLKETGLRLKLRLSETPELVDVPWEYLYDPNVNDFLSLSLETPIARYMHLATPIPSLAVQLPLRILVMLSNPSNSPQLNVEEEWAKLNDALGDLRRRGLVEVDRLEHATLLDLQRQLRRDEYHIFHFIGHGDFDKQTQEGVLIMEDENQQRRQVSAQVLGSNLHDESTLRLALLNACEGARNTRSDPFAGTAQRLVQKGIPAVIAMQFEMSDEAAITLAHQFFEALADGYPVDAALTEARKAIYFQGNETEWGTPALYMRSPDGRIFDVELERSRKKTAPRFGKGLAFSATLEERDWSLLLERINDGECTPFLGAGVCAGVLPSGSKIAEEWAKQYDYPLKESCNDLARVAQFLAVEYDPMFPKGKVRALINNAAPPNFKEKDEPHRVLADFPLAVYMTTNYDDFMVQALKSHQKDPKQEFCRWNKFIKDQPSIFDAESDYKPTPANPVVYHLHGHCKVRQSLVLTEDDYLDFLIGISKDQDLLPPRIREAWAGTSLLFLGYRLADWDFRVLFHSIVSYLERSIGLAHVSVQLVPGDDKRSQEERKKAQDYLNRYFSKLEIRVYWGTCHEFCGELRKRWEAFNRDQ